MSVDSERYVCDLSTVMRTRLLCGLYNHRAVRPCLRPLARAYCLIPIIVALLFFYFTYTYWTILTYMSFVPSINMYLLASFVSLWSGDEFIYTFYYQNKYTYVTLDAPSIFNRLQKQINKSHVMCFAILFIYICQTVAVWFRGGVTNLWFIVPSLMLEWSEECSSSTKLLIMGLFNSRLEVLRRRLERNGFRTVGRAQVQPYCRIYNEILQGLDAMNNPLKLMLFCDLILNNVKLISMLIFYFYELGWGGRGVIESIVLVCFAFVTIMKRLALAFGHVALLESAARHCDHMAVFTVTQLIKTPTAEERRRMYQFLDALEARGARYQVLRALTLDARLVLQALGFCTAQALVLYNNVNV